MFKEKKRECIHGKCSSFLQFICLESHKNMLREYATQVWKMTCLSSVNDFDDSSVDDQPLIESLALIPLTPLSFTFCK